jgi:hypothetical protein
MIELYPHQEEALKFLDNGKILWGGVGTGKTLTALYYYTQKESPKDIYVITTARKRDDLDWQGDAVSLGIGMSRGNSLHGVITVDSWNNIGKYVDIEDAFFSLRRFQYSTMRTCSNSLTRSAGTPTRMLL